MYSTFDKLRYSLITSAQRADCSYDNSTQVENPEGFPWLQACG